MPYLLYPPYFLLQWDVTKYTSRVYYYTYYLLYSLYSLYFLGARDALGPPPRATYGQHGSGLWRQLLLSRELPQAALRGGCAALGHGRGQAPGLLKGVPPLYLLY